MNVLFICTSNKDRSVALQDYFSELYPEHTYNSAGVNKYFCTKNKTTYLTLKLLQDADVVVFAEEVHKKIVIRDFGDGWSPPHARFFICLNLGNYEQGNINEDYLTKAEYLIGQGLKQTGNFSNITSSNLTIQL